MKRFVLAVIVLLFLGTGSAVFAAFGVDGDGENFEGTFPPSGWTVQCNTTSYGCWEKDSGYINTGYNAQSIYGDYLLDTSLITPSFSTVGYGINTVKLAFAGYFYFYSGYGNKCDLQYSTDGGSTWTTIKTWGDYGSVTEERITLPPGALGQPDVRLRWHRYTSSYPYYYAVVDNVRLYSTTGCPTHLCYSVRVECDNDYDSRDYIEACLNDQDYFLVASSYCLTGGFLPLKEFGYSGGFKLDQDRVFLGSSQLNSLSCPGEWYFHLRGHNMHTLDGIAYWYDPSVRCTYKGRQVPLSNCNPE